MSNLEMLQKLTLGTEATEKVTIIYNEEEREFLIRPLTDGELTKIQSLEKKGFVMKIGVDGKGKRQKVETNTDVDVNAGDFNECQYEAMYTAIAWSLSIDEDIPIDQVKGLPYGLPQLLFNEVIRVSGLTDDDLTVIKQFRRVD